MKDIFVAILSIVTSLFLVLLLVCLGWYIVWKVFLSRFKFVRELLGSTEARSADANAQPARSSRKTRLD